MNTAFVVSQFGIQHSEETIIGSGVEIDYQPGKIVLFTGPSGSGKSSLLRIAESILRNENGPHHPICNIAFMSGKDAQLSLIDELGSDPEANIGLLGAAGLADATIMLRSIRELSDGQKYRARIAMALASECNTIIADEWCSCLDRITARVLCRNVRRIAAKKKVGFLLATAHDDLADDLQPDIIVRCDGKGGVDVTSTPFRGARPISFIKELWISEGAKSDWPHFARWHYRGHGIAIIDRIFVLWHKEEPIAICMFGFPALQCAQRNRHFEITTKKYPTYKARMRMLNRNFRTIHRIVIDPRYRGAGIAGDFLRACCALMPQPWIELVSVMAGVVPFAERAGFRFVGFSNSKLSGGAVSIEKWHSDKARRRNKNTGKNQERRAESKPVTTSQRPAYFLLDNRENRRAKRQ